MMRFHTEEEDRLLKKLRSPDTPEDEKETIRKRLIEIDEEMTKDWPFAH